MRILKSCLLAFCLCAIHPTHTAQARELFGRTGLGYNAQFGQTSTTDGIPGVSIKYGLNPRTMIELVGGYLSGTNSSGVAALKWMQTLHSESYANFYFLFGGGFVSIPTQSGSEFTLGLGAEFFIPGLESVGISFETGMALDSYSSASTVLKTFGASFIHAGMHFYL